MDGCKVDAGRSVILDKVRRDIVWVRGLTCSVVLLVARLVKCDTPKRDVGVSWAWGRGAICRRLAFRSDGDQVRSIDRFDDGTRLAQPSLVPAAQMA